MVRSGGRRIDIEINYFKNGCISIVAMRQKWFLLWNTSATTTEIIYFNIGCISVVVATGRTWLGILCVLQVLPVMVSIADHSARKYFGIGIMKLYLRPKLEFILIIRYRLNSKFFIRLFLWFKLFTHFQWECIINFN